MGGDGLAGYPVPAALKRPGDCHMPDGVVVHRRVKVGEVIVVQLRDDLCDGAAVGLGLVLLRRDVVEQAHSV